MLPRLSAPLALLLTVTVACSGADDRALVPDVARSTPGSSVPVASPSSPSPEEVTSPTPSARATSDDQELRERLAVVLADPRFAVVGPVGVSVLDGRGHIVFEHRPRVGMLPASTQKMVTAAAALRTLGAGYRYRTAVRATGPIGTDGTLEGDLVIVGSGDPALATPRYGAEAYPQRPRTPLESLADQLVASGLRRLTGSVVADPRVFADEPLAPGWPERYVTERETRLVSGLTVNAGLRLFERDGRVVSDIVDDPAAETARELYRLLEERGVQIDYAAISSRSPPATEAQLAEVRSPTMLEMLEHTLRRSDNHMADAIFLTMALEEDGTGTWSGAAEIVERALADLDLDRGQTTFADGSGLSREDRLNAAFLSSLDLEMGRTHEHWAELMAASGRSNSLRRRLRGTLAEGRIHGKTGTLDDVRALAGSIAGPLDERYHFAVLTNELSGAARWPAREVTDEIVLTLVEDLYGCVRMPVEPPTPVPTPSPYRLECTD